MIRCSGSNRRRATRPRPFDPQGATRQSRPSSRGLKPAPNLMTFTRTSSLPVYGLPLTAAIGAATASAADAHAGDRFGTESAVAFGQAATRQIVALHERADEQWRECPVY